MTQTKLDRLNDLNEKYMNNDGLSVDEDNELRSLLEEALAEGQLNKEEVKQSDGKVDGKKAFWLSRLWSCTMSMAKKVFGAIWSYLQRAAAAVFGFAGVAAGKVMGWFKRSDKKQSKTSGKVIDINAVA